MTQKELPGIKSEHVKWGEPIGWRGNDWDDVWLMSFVGERPQLDGELLKWRTAEVRVGTTIVEERAGIGLSHKQAFCKVQKNVIGEGWRYDTMYLSLWICADLINHNWWITYRHDPARALARGSCYGFAAAADALTASALALLDRGAAQVRRVPRVQPAARPADKPPVSVGHTVATGGEESIPRER